MRASTICILALVLGALPTGCRNTPSTPTSVMMPPVPAAATDFSGDAAFGHLQALTAIGPRPAGSPGAEAARTYIRTELERLGLSDIEERRYSGPPGPDGAPQELVNLVATIPGASPQLFVLTAAYDTRPFDSFRFVGANDGASGPALLLELARMVAARPLPYTTKIVFLDRDAPRAGDPTGTPLLAGSSLLATELTSEGRAGNVRLVVSFQQVGDAELRIARDLRSHRLFREEFWLAAARLGRSEAFRSDDRFESPVGNQTAFLSAGLRGVVLITDTSYGGDEPPGAWANSEDDTPERCSPQSLATVGVVTLEALERIGARLAKIDRYAKKVSAEPAPAPPEPAATSQPPTETGGGAPQAESTPPATSEAAPGVIPPSEPPWAPEPQPPAPATPAPVAPMPASEPASPPAP